MPRSAVILQARMGSRRLPGKVLARVGAWSLLEHAVLRLASGGLDVVVATTDGAEDDVVADEARRAGASVFRGSSQDVLGRFVNAAGAYGLDLVVRATADNPFVDADGPGRVLALLQRLRADYVVESGMPLGSAVEAVTTRTLARAASLAVEPFDREHVTTLVRRDPRFRAVRSMAPALVRRSDLRLTVDTPEDLEFARRVWQGLDTRRGLPSLPAVIEEAARTVRSAQAPARVVGA